jgi:hypothetical protein
MLCSWCGSLGGHCSRSGTAVAVPARREGTHRDSSVTVMDTARSTTRSTTEIIDYTKQPGHSTSRDAAPDEEATLRTGSQQPDPPVNEFTITLKRVHLHADSGTVCSRFLAAPIFREWTGADVCRAQDARIEKLKAEKLGIGRRRAVTRCTCDCGGGRCTQSRLDLLVPTALGPRCLVCMIGTPPLCQCDCDGCTAMKVDQVVSFRPGPGPAEIEELDRKDAPSIDEQRALQDHTDHEIQHRALERPSVCCLSGWPASKAGSFAASHQCAD